MQCIVTVKHYVAEDPISLHHERKRKRKPEKERAGLINLQ